MGRSSDESRRRHRGRRAAVKWGGVLVAGILVFTGCGPAAVDASNPALPTDAQTGGTLRIASLAETKGFDPLNAGVVGSGLERAAAVMDTLLVRDEATDEVLPKLAAGIESDDGKVWRLALREGVNFTDGTPLNSEAVIFNLQRHLAPDSLSPAKSLLSDVESMEATSPLEVTFTLTEPNGSFPLALTGSSPAGLIGSPTALADPESFNSHPVGAGPFVFDSWVPDATLTLTRNEDYWDDGRPYVDSVVYEVMVDEQTRAAALLSGDVDVALINANQWTQVSEAAGVRLHPTQTGGQALVFNAERGATADKRVRQAIRKAFDSKISAQVLFGGTQVWNGDATCVPFPQESAACAPEYAGELDLETAEDLVADFVEDGGEPTLSITYFTVFQDRAVYIQDRLAGIGITASLEPFGPGKSNEIQEEGLYDIFIGSTATSGYPTVWTRLYSQGGHWGMSTYPALDEALLRARNSVELADRSAAWHDVARIIDEEAILLWTDPYYAAMAHGDEVHLDIDALPYAGSTMVYVDSAWIQQ